MKRIITLLFASLSVGLAASAKSTAAPSASLVIREIDYSAQLADDETRVRMNLIAEATGDGESSVRLLDGDVAVLPGKLSSQLKIVRAGSTYYLVATHSGRFEITLDVAAKIQHADPWNQIAFHGPSATIASVTAQAAGTNTEVQLLAGTLLQSFRTNGVSGVKGFLGADTTVALRWQGKVTAVARKALLTVDSVINVQATPAVIKYTSKFHYDIVQGNAAQLELSLPASQALTRLEGDQIRDWHLATSGDRQTLTIEFIKPIENSYDLTLYSEQPADGASEISDLDPPQPRDTDRETGSLTVFAEDTLVEVAHLAGLRQVNAPDKAVVAYRYNTRPFTLTLKLKHIEPVVTVADRVSARLEETRLVANHALSLTVEKAGIYSLDLTPPVGFAVADVRGDGIEDWKVSDGRLRINFSARVLGSQPLNVQLEEPLKAFPEQIVLSPLPVAGAARETAKIGVASAPGIRLKTALLSGLREISVRELQQGAAVQPMNASQPQRPMSMPVPPADEILAYVADQPDWKVTIGSERLAARVVADVFNLITIGDGVVSGSATIRYGMVNQGVQQFQVRLPAQCKNVEFTGPNIRRKEQSGNVWTIGLQDKVWGGYTLVITYDFQFDARDATLPIGGIHPVNVERETGSLAVTTAASLQLSAKSSGDTLHRVDESELADADRSLITRAVVIAWQYAGDQYDLNLAVRRFAEVPLLPAVADRTQITSVLTEAGEMLTQASFMVKNNEQQFQRFQLPADSRLWGCYVNGQPAKPERDADWVLVPLPRDANRDQAFAVDIMYAQTNGVLAATFGRHIQLNAPRTDVPNTYAEWQLFVPPSLRLSDFGGTMNVTQGTTYELLDAWEKFLTFYGQVLHELGLRILVFIFLAMLVVVVVIFAVKRGSRGVLELLVVLAILAILGAMMLPALSSAKRKAQSVSSMSNLKQIGLAARIFSGDNNDRLPMSFEEMKNELSTDKITYDPVTGQRYTYLGAGMSLDNLSPDSVLAYSSPDQKGYSEVLFVDGSVQRVSGQRFAQLSQRGLVQLAGPQELAQKQREAVAAGQLAARLPAAVPPQSVAGVSGFAGGGGAVGMTTFSGGVVDTNGLPVAPAVMPPSVVAGIRSIRIELPQTGTPFMFTKVLNVHGDPLSISARVISLRSFQTMQMLWQSAAFVLGLAVWWLQWRRARRNTFILTLALALIIGSVCSLLIQWRALHDVLIVGFPVAVVALIAWLVWKYWPRSRKVEDGEKPAVPPPTTGSDLPPVLTSMVLAALLALGWTNSANAAEAAKSLPAITNLNAAMVAATYSGSVNDRVAQLEAILHFSSIQEGDIVPLFGSDVAVQAFDVQCGRARLIRQGDGLAVQFERRGEAAIQVKLLVKVAGDVTKRRLGFGIPAALTSEVTLKLAEAGADVDFPAAISFKRTLEQDATCVEAVLGNTDKIELFWTPRVKRAEEVAATVFCRNAALATFGGGVMNIRATLRYQITQGELRQARIQLPAGQKLLRVEGQDIRTWEIRDENGSQVLVVDLMKGVPLAWQLTVETETQLDTLPASAPVALPHALDVKRENGLIALRGVDEIGLSVDSSTGLERVDAEEFARAVSQKADKLASVFRFAGTKFALRVHAEACQPEISAMVKNYFQAGSEQLLLSATVDYDIKRAGVFAVSLRLPPDYRVEDVKGANIQQWVEKTEAAGRVLEVTLKDRVLGAYSLNMELARRFKELPPRLALAGVYPLGAAQLTGYVAVSAEPGVEVKTDAFDGLTEIPAATLPNDYSMARVGNVLAFKFVSAEPKSAPEWKLSVATETVAAWVRAEIVHSFRLTETLVSGRAQIHYDIANAPAKEFRVRVPAQFRNVEMAGANIRSREQNGNVWRVELQNPVRGAYALTVTWDEPRTNSAGTLDLTGVSAEGVEREFGMIAISVKPPLQVSEAGAEDLQRADTGGFPSWASGNDTATLAYRYARPGYKLALNVRRFSEAEVLQTLVDSAKLTSVIAADGQMMTEMSLSVRNNGRQFLEIALPDGAKVWSAFVAGQPVQPSLRDGKFLLPIESSGVSAGSLAVELTYVGTNAFPKKRGEVAFASPQFDVPLKNAQWQVYLPPDYVYQDMHQGTMTHEIPTRSAAEPVSSSFSILDYSRMEQANKESAKVEVQRDVSLARRQLIGGNVREATANFNRAKAKNYAGQDEDAEVKKLGDELKSAQASNLINAQNEFYFRNNGQLAADKPQNGWGSFNFGLVSDSAAAGEQWAKLQQAQEIVTAKVQPLHVNLPVRGERIAFAQVLQTESGRPMTFVLSATNTKAVHWPTRVGAVLVGFGVLWALVAMLSHVSGRRREQAV